MPNNHFDLTIKIYAQDFLYKGTYFGVDFLGRTEYPKIIFPFNQNKRLVQMRVQCTFRNNSDGTIVGFPIDNPWDLHWEFWGRFLNKDGTVLKSPLVQYTPFEDQNLIFTVQGTRAGFNSYNMTYNPDCLFIGGFEAEELIMNWRTISDFVFTYIARVRIHFEFEE